MRNRIEVVFELDSSCRIQGTTTLKERISFSEEKKQQVHICYLVLCPKEEK